MRRTFILSTRLNSFGSIMVGRSYERDTSLGYRFGFNGKERDDETYGVGNEIAFESRIYDARLGKSFSMDPLWYKCVNVSPYNFALNCPILVIDRDGKENVIYLILLPSAEGEFSKQDAETIASKTNECLKALGINAEVKVWEPKMEGESFNTKNMDASDKVVFLGEKGDISKAMTVADVNKFYRENDVAKLTECTTKNLPTPEISQLPGDAVALSSKEIVCDAVDFKTDKLTLASFLILHGVGHNSGQEHFNGSAIMMEGQTMVNLIKGFRFDGYKTIIINNTDYTKLSDFINNTPSTLAPGGRNQVYIEAMNEDFKSEVKIKDNYQTNVLANFYKTLFPVKAKVDSNNSDNTRTDKPIPSAPNTPAPQKTE